MKTTSQTKEPPLKISTCQSRKLCPVKFKGRVHKTAVRAFSLESGARSCGSLFTRFLYPAKYPTAGANTWLPHQFRMQQLNLSAEQSLSLKRKSIQTRTVKSKKFFKDKLPTYTTMTREDDLIAKIKRRFKTRLSTLDLLYGNCQQVRVRGVTEL